jgi:predicted ATPase
VDSVLRRASPRGVTPASVARVSGSQDGLRDRRPVRRVIADLSATPDDQVWPASIPAVAQLLREGLELSPGVTMLVGENGSGKSTLVEAVAMAFGLAAEGGTRNVQAGTRTTESPLHDWITLEKSPSAPRWGFFLRAETMHGYFSRMESYAAARDPRFHEMSHGESFIEVLRTRFDGPGLYCLDEPEAAMSFSAQLALVGVLHDVSSQGAQVLCATHSPLLAALPGATILEVGHWGLRHIEWKDLELVTHWRNYLEEPMRYLRHVLGTD